MVRDFELPAHIEATNAANKAANELYTQLLPIVVKLVGQKIEKVDGSLMEKVKKLLPEFPFTPNLRITRHRSDYSLVWSVYATTTGDGNIFSSSEAMVYMGEMRDGVLTAIIPPCVRRTDYNLAELQVKRATAEVARKAYEETKSACFPFGD